MKTSTQTLIVGGGPIGIETAVALTREKIDFQLVEAGSIGHTMSWWAPQTRWFSSNERIAIAGVPLVTPDQTKATREQYLAYLRAVVTQFDLTVRSYEKVVSIARRGDGFTATTKSAKGDSEIDCQTIVLAIGGTDHPRRLGVGGETLPHVDGYLREPHRYYGRRVMIIGGRNSAAEAALRLHHAGAKVCISYRGSELPADGIKYWLYPELCGLIQTGRIEAFFGTQPIQITPQSVILSRVDQEADGKIEVPADDCLSLIGYEQDKTLLRNAGVELVGETDRPVYDEQTMQSNVKGIYIAGTAVAGTQTSRYKTFLENCHHHVDKIVADLTGKSPRPLAEPLSREIAAQPES